MSVYLSHPDSLFFFFLSLFPTFVHSLSPLLCLGERVVENVMQREGQRNERCENGMEKVEPERPTGDN